MLSPALAAQQIRRLPGRRGRVDGRDAYARAIGLEARGNYSAALALLWYASGAAPHDADIQNALGEALVRIGALDAAMTLSGRALAERRAISKSREQPDPDTGQGWPRRGGGDAGEGARCEARRDAEGLFTLGLPSPEQDIDEAIATFRRVLQLDPGTPSHATTSDWR